jgi:hypothetical protein
LSCNCLIVVSQSWRKVWQEPAALAPRAPCSDCCLQRRRLAQTLAANLLQHWASSWKRSTCWSHTWGTWVGTLWPPARMGQTLAGKVWNNCPLLQTSACLFSDDVCCYSCQAPGCPTTFNLQPCLLDLCRHRLMSARVVVCTRPATSVPPAASLLSRVGCAFVR